ncbi:MAG: type I-A CRISPR-associated protein Cas7/Csa2, partial [Pyrobaculum sp.]
NNIIEALYKEVAGVVKMTDPCEVERELVGASVVGDVTGFLYTDKLVKRTSRVRFSSLVPSLDAVSTGAAASYPQFHVRYAPPDRQELQQIYYLESGSALYTLSAVFVASDVAELEYCGKESALPDKKERVEAALKALVALLDGLAFGAKKSRNNPVWDVRSLVVSVSKGPIEFVVSPAVDKDYFKNTVQRAATISNVFTSEGKHLLQIKMFKYDREGLTELQSSVPINISTHDTHTEALERASSLVLQLI